MVTDTSTHLSDLFDVDQLDEMLNADMVRRFEHVSGDLLGYEYTQRAQWGRVWNPVTLQCRGLLATSDGRVVARPFPKFFNLGEQPDSDSGRLGEPFTVYEKLDGSLGVHYRWNDEDCIATRGSFHSPQAEWATEYLRSEGLMHSVDPIDRTYLFEIIYPENRVVVDYGERRALIFLAALDIKTGQRLRDSSWSLSGRAASYEVPAAATASDVAVLYQHLDNGNFEGFVIEYADGHRVKVKLDEYVRLHRIMSATSNRTIWEALRAGSDITKIFESVPDEFYEWARNLATDMRREYRAIEIAAQLSFSVISSKVGTENRKAFALLAKEKPTAAILFAMLDGKDYTDSIWKRLRPADLEYPPLGGAGVRAAVAS